MYSRKYGIFALAAVSLGVVTAAPVAIAAPDEVGPRVTQTTGHRSTAANRATHMETTGTHSSRRAQLDAQEREVTKRLNEQQLHAGGNVTQAPERRPEE